MKVGNINYQSKKMYTFTPAIFICQTFLTLVEVEGSLEQSLPEGAVVDPPEPTPVPTGLSPLNWRTLGPHQGCLRTSLIKTEQYLTVFCSFCSFWFSVSCNFSRDLEINLLKTSVVSSFCFAESEKRSSIRIRKYSIKSKPESFQYFKNREV